MELRPRQSGNQFLATLVYEGTNGHVSLAANASKGYLISNFVAALPN
jgi:hypothetical protein